MIWTPQAHFTTLYHPINQGNSETQRKPTVLFVAFDAKNVGFRWVSLRYAGISGLMYFEMSTFGFQPRSTHSTQRKLPPYFQQRALGFTGLLYAYTSMLDLMRFGIQTFDFNTVLPNLQKPHENSKLTFMIFAYH